MSIVGTTRNIPFQEVIPNRHEIAAFADKGHGAIMLFVHELAEDQQKGTDKTEVTQQRKASQLRIRATSQIENGKGSQTREIRIEKAK
jgi:hypothetical protein